MSKSTISNWVPEIMYEEADGTVASQIPFIMVPNGEEMPSLLYMFESRETGEFEPGVDGEAVPVVQWDLHQYADMIMLKEGLPVAIYDMVRQSLGLETLAIASVKGQKISQNVRENINKDNDDS